MPPGFGFVAYWRIYIAATQFGGPALITALVVAALDLLCYARAIHRTWLGPPEVPVTGAPACLARGVLACLTVILYLTQSARGRHSRAGRTRGLGQW